MANEENGKPKAVETIDFEVKLFSDVAGERIDSAKYSPKFDENKRVKVICNIPVPKDDETAQKLFNLSLQDLIARGVRQLAYGERFVTDFLKDKQDLTEAELETIRKETENALFITERERTAPKAAAKIGKAAKNVGLEASDFDDVEFQKLLAAYKKKKAAQA